MYQILLGIIIAMGGAGYWYYNESQEELKYLRELSSSLKQTYAEQLVHTN